MLVKRIVASLTAVLVAISGLSAMASDHVDPTVGVAEIPPNRSFLVDHNGKALYYFAPYGISPTPMEEEWQGVSRMWIGFWQPVMLSSPDALVIDEAVHDVHVFSVERISRNGETVYQLFWGGPRTEGKPYWPLYTSVLDEPARNYEMSSRDKPPGWVAPIWIPATNTQDGAPEPASTTRDDVPPGGVIGDSQDGGP